MRKSIVCLVLCLIISVGLTSCEGSDENSNPSPGGISSDTTAPSVPTGLTATAASSSSIGLNWTASTDDVGVTGYKIFRNGTQINTSTINAFSDAGLSSSTTYTYTVSAYDVAGNNSAQSTTSSATTLATGITDTTPPNAPTNLSATAVSSTQIDLSWTVSTDNVGVAGYEIYRDAVLITTVTGTTHSDTGLSANTSYTYTVKAFDGANNKSAASPSATATTTPSDSTPPTVPSNLSAVAVSSSEINLSWTAASDNEAVTGYKIYRDGAYLKSNATISALDSGLTSSANYCYTISAIDSANNESSQSGQSCATTNVGVMKIPDTGQFGNMDYTATFGEDGDYTINSPSYSDNGNGTVTDNVTGLVWQKQDAGEYRSWDAAGTYCDGLTLGDHADWRLPTRMELLTIVDFGRYNPAINLTYFPSTYSEYTPYVGYWSSTAHARSTTSAWIVRSLHGATESLVKTDGDLVRCVRGGQYPAQNFTDNCDGTVTDTVTTLMWQKQDDGTVRSWESAITYCEGLSLAYRSDWRLPNAKELSSLVDDSRFQPAIDSVFTGTQSWGYWSSTSCRDQGPYAWSVGFSYGNTSCASDSDKGGTLYVRCVR